MLDVEAQYRAKAAYQQTDSPSRNYRALLRKALSPDGVRYGSGTLMAGVGFLGIIGGVFVAGLVMLDTAGQLLAWAAGTTGLGIVSVLTGAWLRQDTREETRIALRKAVMLPLRGLAEYGGDSEASPCE